MRRSILGVIVIMMLFTLGCAFVDQKVPLVYNQEVAGVNGEKYGPIQIEKPTPPDLETTKNGLVIIGNVKNTYGMKTADTVTGDSVSDWVAQALSIELKAVGFAPQVVDSVSSSTGQGVKTRVLKVWVEQDPGFWTVGAIGEVQLRIALYRNGKRIKEFDIESKGQGDRSMIDSASTKEESLRIALETCMKKAIPIIVDTYSKE